MEKGGSILVVDDNRGILKALEILLKGHFGSVATVTSPNLIDSKFMESSIDVVLLDMNFTSQINNGNEGLYWLNHIKTKYPDTQVVVFTAYADIELAVEAVKRGAADFVVKPWNNEKLLAVLNNAYSQRRNEHGEVKVGDDFAGHNVQHREMIWGKSRVMQELRRTVEKIAATDANILITGENGTGKEVISREIHRLSKRADRMFVPVDMGAIVETLFESELFGHKRGAFTDAKSDRVGKFEQAHNGTLFLDEIGNLPIHLQAKLLTALQSGSIVRVGENMPIPIDIRLISATNRDLDLMVQRGGFRQDLLYRINTIHIHLPALRERREDILPLSDLFLNRFSKRYSKGNLIFSDQAVEALLNYSWPGNIRELEHAIEKCVILSDGQVIMPESFMLKEHGKSNLSGVGDNNLTPDNFQTFDEMERAMIKAAIDKHCGNLSAVASQLQITRQTLYNKMKKYGL